MAEVHVFGRVTNDLQLKNESQASPLGPSKCNYYFFVYSNNSISHKSSTGPVEC